MVVKVIFDHDWLMIESSPDTWFKLRLSGSLRARLEGEAARHGITLTAEILRRIEETFSDTSARFDALERQVFDKGQGNEALKEQLDLLSQEIDNLRVGIHALSQRTDHLR